MSQLSKWMNSSKISKLVVVITDKETGEHVERWQFDVGTLGSVVFSCTNLPFRCKSSTNLARRLQAKRLVTRRTPCPSTRSVTSFPTTTDKKVQRKRSTTGENGQGNPRRDPVHLPTNHRLCHLSPTTRRQLYLQRTRVCRCRLRRAPGVGR
jgi:hypothetical protein